MNAELLLLPIALILMVLSAAYLFSKFWDWSMNRKPRKPTLECRRCGLVERETIHAIEPRKGGHPFQL
jgi:hypothetical protein